MAIATGPSPTLTAAARRPDRRDDWRQTVWMGFRLETPGEWEILRHAIRREQGRLVFVDRRRQRLQLSWARMNRPDVSQVMTDYRNRDREENPDVRFEPIHSLNGWTGFHRKGLTRLALYEPARRLMIEMTIEWPGERDASIETGLTETFEALDEPPPIEPPDTEDEIAFEPSRWRAFGLDVTAPAGWSLTRTDIRPADTTLFFDDLNHSSRRAQVRRAGMIDAWFDGSLERFVRRYVGLGPEIEHEPVVLGERTGLLSRSVEKATKFKRLSGRAPVRRDLTWLDRDAAAVIAVTTWSVGEKHRADPLIFSACGVCTR